MKSQVSLELNAFKWYPVLSLTLTSISLNSPFLNVKDQEVANFQLVADKCSFLIVFISFSFSKIWTFLRHRVWLLTTTQSEVTMFRSEVDSEIKNSFATLNSHSEFLCFQ